MSPALVVAIVLGVALVAALIIWRQPVFAFTQRSVAYIQIVRGEVRKVTWPTWDDLRQMTIVITIFVIIVGIIIGIMDWISSKLLIDFLGRLFG